jgi:hypothetical protein
MWSVIEERLILSVKRLICSGVRRDGPADASMTMYGNRTSHMEEQLISSQTLPGYLRQQRRGYNGTRRIRARPKNARRLRGPRDVLKIDSMFDASEVASCCRPDRATTCAARAHGGWVERW